MARPPNTRPGGVRIIGGTWRRRRLDFGRLPGHLLDRVAFRPTPDRVRETLFNWLGQSLAGDVCLDLFAGSGALGFEAASRGAARVTLVEGEAVICRWLAEQVEHLGAAGQIEVVHADAIAYLIRLAKGLTGPSQRRFCGVFCDPPYASASELWDNLALLLPQVLADDGWIYAESPAPIERLGHWQAVKQGRAGQVYHQLLRRHA